MQQTFSSLGCLVVLGAALGAVSCGGKVLVDHYGDGGSSSGTGTGTGTVTGDPPDEAAAVVAAACPEIAAEPHYCLTFGYPDTVWAVGPDTGNLCPIGTLEKEVVSDVSSVAVTGTSVHGCSYGSTWRAAILGGAVETLDVPCSAITGYQGGFLHVPYESFGVIHQYATFDDIGTANVFEVYEVDPTFSRISTRGATLFTAWHATTSIEVYALPSAAPQPALVLDGFDDWVNGMSATADGRLYILSSGDRIVAFDLGSGAQIQEVNTEGIPGGLLAALHCWSN